MSKTLYDKLDDKQIKWFNKIPRKYWPTVKDIANAEHILTNIAEGRDENVYEDEIKAMLKIK